jgi:hypothetical protein
MTQQNMPQPPKMGRQDGLAPSVKDAPENVRYGVRAWYTVAVLQLLTAVLQMVMNLQDRRTVVQQVREQTKNVDLPSGITQDALVNGTIVAGLLVNVIAVAVCSWLTSRAGRGGARSRMLLCVGSVYLALMAVIQAFSSAPDTGSTTVVLFIGVGTILSGVVAVVGMWLMLRSDNAKWFGMPDRKEIEEYADQLARRSAELDEEKKAKKAEKDRQKRDRSGKGR